MADEDANNSETYGKRRRQVGTGEGTTPATAQQDEFQDRDADDESAEAAQATVDEAVENLESETGIDGDDEDKSDWKKQLEEWEDEESDERTEDGTDTQSAEPTEWEQPLEDMTNYEEGMHVQLNTEDNEFVEGEIVTAKGPTVSIETEDGNTIHISGTAAADNNAQIFGIDSDDIGDRVDLTGKPPIPQSVDLGNTDPEAIEKEFALDLDDTEDSEFYNGKIDPEDIDEEFPRLNMDERDLRQHLKNHYGNEVDDEAVDQVIGMLNRWKGNTKNSDAKTVEAIAQRALGIEDADIRDVRGDVEWEKVNDDTIRVYRDMARISQGFMECHYADDDGKMTLQRGMASMTNTTNVLESYLENPDADQYNIGGSVVENYTTDGDGGDAVAHGFTRTFKIEQDVDVDDVAMAMDMVGQPGSHMREAEIHVRGDNMQVDSGDIVVPDDDDLYTSIITDSGPIDDHMGAVRNPSEADKDEVREFSRIMRRWRRKAVDTDSDGDVVDTTDRYRIESEDAKQTLRQTVDEGEAAGWSTAKVEEIKDNAEDIVVGEMDWEASGGASSESGSTETASTTAGDESYGAAGGTSPGTSDYDFSEFTLEEADEWGSLSEYSASSGVTASDMKVGVLPGHDPDEVGDEGLAFVTEYSEGFDGAKPSLGTRAMTAADAAAELGGSVPEHVGDPEGEGWVAVEGVTDATEASKVNYSSEYSADSVDSETFYDEAATQLIVDNFDAHSDNVMVDREGNVHFHDLDHAGGELAGDYVGNKPSYENNVDRALGELSETAAALEVGSGTEVKERMLSRAEERAQSMTPSEIDTVVDAASQHDEEYAENIRQNIQDLRDGTVRERWEEARQ